MTDRATIKTILTGIMGDFPTDHLLDVHADTIESLLEERETVVCQYITGDNRITTKTTVKAMFYAMREELKDGR